MEPTENMSVTANEARELASSYRQCMARNAIPIAYYEIKKSASDGDLDCIITQDRLFHPTEAQRMGDVVRELEFRGFSVRHIEGQSILVSWEGRIQP